MKSLIFLSISFLFFSCGLDTINENVPAGNSNATIEVTFPFFTPDSVKIQHDFSTWGPEYKMDKSLNKFTYTIATSSGNHSFSIRYWYHSNSPVFDESSWINSKTGIKYSTIKINGTASDYHYLVDNGLGGSTFYFNLHSDGSISTGDPDPNHPALTVDDRVPAEVTNAKKNKYDTLNMYGYQYVLPWMQAIHDIRYNETSTVEVQYIKLYAKVGGSYNLIKEQYYTGSSFNDGGLFLRYPWYPPGDYHEPMPANIFVNVLTMNPSGNSNRVWHWWQNSSTQIPAGWTAFKMEAYVRITGHCIVQGGIDFKNIVNNASSEIGNSDWYLPSTSWQLITFDSGN